MITSASTPRDYCKFSDCLSVFMNLVRKREHTNVSALLRGLKFEQFLNRVISLLLVRGNKKGFFIKCIPNWAKLKKTVFGNFSYEKWTILKLFNLRTFLFPLDAICVSMLLRISSKCFIFYLIIISNISIIIYVATIDECDVSIWTNYRADANNDILL